MADESPLQRRYLGDLQLAGLSGRTQAAYVRAVRQLDEHFETPLETITDEQLREYFLHVMTVKKWSRPSCTIALCAIRILFERTLKRPWTSMEFVRPAREEKLPVILSVEEVRAVLGQVRLARLRACLCTIYSCGLRLGEGTRLKVADIDSGRKLIHVRGGKGNKDRYVPLPQSTLQILRTFWRTHRNPVWIFPAPEQGGVMSPVASRPLHPSGVQDAFRKSLVASGLHKKASVHTLRHSWATHLLEANVNLRLIQIWLGHSSLSTTALYTHLTASSTQAATKIIDALMDGLE